MSGIDFRTKLEKLKGRREHAISILNQHKKKFRNLRRENRDLERAQVIIQEVAAMTQQELEYRVSDLVSLALSSVFSSPYTFKVNFVKKRGKTEAELVFKRGEGIRDPLKGSGGGTVDVAAFALRLSAWNLPEQSTRPIFILDEPFKNINDKTRQLHWNTANLVKDLADRLGVQFIMISHIPEIMEMVDEEIEL